MKRVFLLIGTLSALILIMMQTRSERDDGVYAYLRVLPRVGEQASSLFGFLRDTLRESEAFESYNLERFRWSGNLTGDEMFIYYAYLELRDPAGPKIRMLVNAVCSILKKEDVLIDVGAEMPLPLERAMVLGTGGCNGGGGGHCRLQEMEFTSVVWRGPVPDEITVHRKGFQGKVKLHRMHKEYKQGINSCIIAPLFWYNDWIRLFVNIEFWKKTGVGKILIHVHSVSESAKRLLDYYVDEGVVDIRPFPWMPYTDNYNPNDHTYYAAEHITTFFCALWSDTVFTTMNDIDELFWVRTPNETLLQLVERLTDAKTHPDVAALWLGHHALVFSGPMVPEPWDFENMKELDFLRNPIGFEQGRAGKYLYKTQYAKLPWIHGMREFYSGKRDEMIPKESAVYLHMRSDYLSAENKTNIFPGLQLFNEQELANLHETLDYIYRGFDPTVEMAKTNPVVEECRIKSTKQFKDWDCIMPTGSICHDAMKDLDQWLYAMPTENSMWTPI